MLMTTLTGSDFWIALWRIVVVDVLLSGDNAVVIALACRNLPVHHRNRAVLAGTAGAVLVRIALCFVVASLLVIPAIKLVGGVLLLWIGVKLLLPEEADSSKIQGSSGVWGAMQTIIIADLVMSLDNVIAIAAAARGDMVLIGIGLGLSIPLIVFGSQLVLKVLHRFPMLVTFGAGLLGWLAGEIMITDVLVQRHLPGLPSWSGHLAAVIGASIVVGVGALLKRRDGAHSAAQLDAHTGDSK